MKPVVTPHKAENIFSSMQCMAILAELMDIEYRWYLHDSRFASPIINQHKKRIRESITAIQQETISQVKTKDREYFTDSHCPDMYEVLRFLMFMPKEDLQDTLNQIREHQAELKKKIA